MYNNIAEASSTLNRLLPIESLVHTKNALSFKWCQKELPHTQTNETYPDYFLFSDLTQNL